MSVIVSIDPGKKGGFCVGDGRFVKNASVMPLMGKDIDISPIVNQINITKPKREEVFVCLEKVSARPGQGVSSMFAFGKGYGQIIGMCQALGYRYDFVTPQKWKKVVLEGTAKDKEAAIDYCRRRFPEISLIPKGCRKSHDGIADALCIWDYVIKNYREYGIEI